VANEIIKAVVAQYPKLLIGNPALALARAGAMPTLPYCGYTIPSIDL
jgi:hypothetical protein